MRKNQLILFIVLTVSLFGFTSVLADEVVVNPTNINQLEDIDIYNLDFAAGYPQKGHTFALGESDFRLGIFPGVLSVPTEVIVKRRTYPAEIFPDGLSPLSDSWEFDLTDKKSYNNKNPLIVELKYLPSANWKSIYYWTGAEWRAISSTVVDHERGIIRAKLNFSYARLIVLGDTDKMSEGQASWYRYKGCDCAASPDYAKGTLLKVTNLDNNKSVAVEVNDFGPDRAIHPDRVIDLDVTAYTKIAKKGSGVCNVLVEPILKK